MKKIEYILFVVLCLFFCAVPVVGMSIQKTDSTTENRTLASLPEWKKDDKWNQDYFEEFGSYFEDHFAFRNAFVMADSVIQSKVFGVSNVDTVLVGENGWLYYNATVPDYKGEKLMSQRAIFNAAHNMKLLQNYVEAKGGAFYLTIAPNKNSLYEENMPYYAERKVSDSRNIVAFKTQLAQLEVSYVDLFAAFESEDEVLYMERDSHWNNKGAVLAYNQIMDVVGKEHQTYATVMATRTKTAYGDLNYMVYPYGGEPEWDYCYQYEPAFQYVTDTKSVEDAWIETCNEEKKGSLLMFRDSFGNTLLPLFAEEYGNAVFAKAIPYAVETAMQAHQPDTVIVECVERNIRQFTTEPPLMTGNEIVMGKVLDRGATNTTMNISVSEQNASYISIAGQIDEECIKENDQIYISLEVDGEAYVYEAFTVSNENTDYGYLLYLPAAIWAKREVGVCVIVGDSQEARVVLERKQVM